MVGINNIMRLCLTTAVAVQAGLPAPPKPPMAPYGVEAAHPPCPPGMPCPPPPPHPTEDCDEEEIIVAEKIKPWTPPVPVSTIIETIIGCPPEHPNCPNPTPKPCPPEGCKDECHPDVCIVHPKGMPPPPCPPGSCLPPCPDHCPPIHHEKPICYDDNCHEFDECSPEICIVVLEGEKLPWCSPEEKNCLPQCPPHCPPVHHEKPIIIEEDCEELPECAPEVCVFFPIGGPAPPCPPGGKCLPPCPPHCPPHKEVPVHEKYPVCPPEGCPPVELPECKPEVCIIVIEGEEAPFCGPKETCLPHCPPHCPPRKEVPVKEKYPVCPPEGCPECKPEVCVFVLEGEEAPYCGSETCLPTCPPHCPAPAVPVGKMYPVCPPEGCPPEELPECKPEVCVIVIEGEKAPYCPDESCLPACPPHCPLRVPTSSALVPTPTPKPYFSTSSKPMVLPPATNSPEVIPYSGAEQLPNSGLFLSFAAAIMALAWI